VLNDPSQTHYKELVELGLTSDTIKPLAHEDGTGGTSWDDKIEKMRKEVANKSS
jgi:hypothetical protein